MTDYSRKDCKYTALSSFRITLCKVNNCIARLKEEARHSHFRDIHCARCLESVRAWPPSPSINVMSSDDIFFAHSGLLTCQTSSTFDHHCHSNERICRRDASDLASWALAGAAWWTILVLLRFAWSLTLFEVILVPSCRSAIPSKGLAQVGLAAFWCKPADPTTVDASSLVIWPW